MSELPYLVFGSASNPTIVLLSGFPDDCTSGWTPKVIDALRKDYLLICVCFPGFDSRDTSRKWGYDFPELVDCLHETIKNATSRQKAINILEQDVNEDSEISFYMITHDWGSHLGQLYENRFPSHVKKLCMLDAGNMKDLPNSIYLSYRYLFGGAYYISQKYNLMLGMMCFRISLILMVLLPFIGPTRGEKMPRIVSDLHVGMCYPFYYTTIMSLFGKARPLPEICSCPLLFIYGGKKNLMLHGPHFLEDIDKKSDSKHILLPNSGHWPTVAEPDIVLKEVKQFFK